MTQPIVANPQVQQELQARGVNPDAGVFGNHQVQFGKSDPVRLDAIKSAPVPFAGFRQATKIASGTKGVAQAGGDALRALTRPGGKLDAGTILGSLKAVRTHIGRLDALGELKGPKGEAALRAYAPLIEKMSNEELSAVYQAFLSREMDVLQTALGHEGREEGSRDAKAAASDLFDIQALVLKETSDRVARGEKMPGSENLPSLSEGLGALTQSPAAGAVGESAAVRREDHITHANLRTLVERGAQSATTRERMTGDFARNVAARDLPAMPAAAIGNILRSAELTMNMDVDFLFENSSILTDPDQHAQNYYHLIEQGRELPGGENYIAPRNEVERMLFPELAGHSTIADERPTYAALNVRQDERGAASAYGTAVIVFRPEVAQRSTYTVGDTFYTIPLAVSQERRDNFYTRLQARADKLPKAFLDEVAKADSPVRQAFERYFDDLAARPGANIALFSHTLPGDIELILDRDESTLVRADLMGAFGDQTQARSRTATYDALEALIPGMSTPTFGSFARAAVQNPDNHPVGLRGVEYIEAQIQGGVVPSRDIAEIRVDEADIPRDPGKKQAMLDKAEAFTRRTGIPVIFEKRNVVENMRRIERETNASGTFTQGHLSRDILDSETHALTDNPLPMLESMMREDPFRSLPAGIKEGLINIQGNALRHALGKFQELAADLRNHPEKLLRITGMDEHNLAAHAFRQVLNPVLERKAALLTELEKLPFANPGQKAAFTNWVMSAKALDSPEELRLIHTAATRQAGILRGLADADPAPAPEAMLQAMSAGLQEDMPSLSRFYTSQQAQGKEFGAEDKNTELTRISFLSLALIRNSDGGDLALNRLTRQLVRPEQLCLSGQMAALAGLGSMASTPGFDVLAATHIFMELTRDNAYSAVGRRAPQATPFIGEISLIPASTRTAIGSIAPELKAHLDSTYPGYPAFPAPSMPERLPQTDSDRRQFLVNHLDAYLNHEQTFERGRSTHGRGHICRAFIFAGAMSNILKEQGISVDRNAVLCGIAGHDMGRQGGGQDRWEGRSATLLTQAMQTDYGATAMGEEYEQAVGDCIVAHGSPTLEGMLINAADSLDIGRTQSFDPDRFAFLQGRGGETPCVPAQTVRAQLAREADLLQRLTDPYVRNRPMLDALQTEALESGDLGMAQFAAQRDPLLRDIARAYEQQWDNSGEDFMQSVEGTIRLNRDLFPLLGKYYTDMAA
jgi:hypothetical protein